MSELSVSCHPYADEEEEFTEDKDEGISENGQEVRLSVRY